MSLVSIGFFFLRMFLNDSVLLLTVFICGVCEYVTTFSYKLFCKYIVIITPLPFIVPDQYRKPSRRGNHILYQTMWILISNNNAGFFLQYE